MKRVFILLLVMTMKLFSFSQVVVTGHVFAEVIEDLAVAEMDNLNFGKFSVNDQGGTISVSPEGSRNTTGGVTAANCEINPASFRVTGQKNAAFHIMLPESDVTLSDGKSGILVLRNWKIKDGKEKHTLSQETEIIYIGATLVVRNRDLTPKGHYSGTYTVRFNYN